MTNNPRFIHETIIRDIIDVASDISSETEPLRGIFNKGSFRSIAKGSSHLTLTFPCFLTENTPVEPGRMIAKAVERKAVTMLQMLFSAMQLSDSTSAIDHIRQIHTNIDMHDDMNVDEFIGVMDKLATNEASGIEIIDQQKYDMVMEDLRNNTHHCLDNYPNPRSINEFTVDTSRIGGIYVEAEGDADWKTMTDISNKQVIDTDVKKANELIPSMMVIKFISTTDGCSTPMNAVIGVKAKLQYVSSNDMITRLVVKNKDKNGLFNFLKAFTRETSFWKDFVFAIDKAKIDAISSSGRGSSSKVWKLLERRALKSRIKRQVGLVNDASAISTLIVSKEEVEMMKKDYQLDLLRPGVCVQLMDAYNIMCIAICDQVLEKVDFLFDDGSNDFETISFTHLEREDNGNYKKVINLLAKSR